MRRAWMAACAAAALAVGCRSGKPAPANGAQDGNSGEAIAEATRGSEPPSLQRSTGPSSDAAGKIGDEAVPVASAAPQGTAVAAAPSAAPTSTVIASATEEGGAHGGATAGGSMTGGEGADKTSRPASAGGAGTVPAASGATDQGANAVAARAPANGAAAGSQSAQGGVRYTVDRVDAAGSQVFLRELAGAGETQPQSGREISIPFDELRRVAAGDQAGADPVALLAPGRTVLVTRDASNRITAIVVETTTPSKTR